MEKIDLMMEQSEFLLAKQKEVEAYFRDQFNSLNSFLEAEGKKYEKMGSGQELISFQNVVTILGNQEEAIMEALADDISFLQAQCNYVEEVKGVKDKTQRDSLIEMMLEGEEITAEMVKFKSDAESEAIDSKESLRRMIEDTKNAILEDKIQDLEAILEESMEAHEEEECIEERNGSCCGCCSSCDSDEPIKNKL